MGAINFSSANVPSPGNMGGIQMGQMGEGGGSNFYMGGDEEEQDEGKSSLFDENNPELVVIDQAKENENTQNRQYLESLITGQNNRPWINPWLILPGERPLQTRQSEQEEMAVYIDEDDKQKYNKKLFIINA